VSVGRSSVLVDGDTAASRIDARRGVYDLVTLGNVGADHARELFIGPVEHVRQAL
jgi:hypothetical protein